MIAIFVERGHHGGVAQRVDQSRHAAGITRNFRESVLGEDLASVRPRHVEAVADVGAHLVVGQRAEVEAQAHALHQLDQLGRIELLVELGLPGQDDAHHLFLGGLDAGQQPDLLEHLEREVLRLVDDEQHLAAGSVLLDQETVDGGDELGLLHLEGREAELDQHRLQEFDRRHLRLVDLRDDDVGVELAQETLDEGGLAGADFAGDHHEAIREPDGGFHVRLGARMHARQVQELRVGAEPERQFLEFEALGVHRSGRYYGKTGPRSWKPRAVLSNCEPGRAIDPSQDLESPQIALPGGPFDQGDVAELAARAGALAIVVPVQARLGQEGLPGG